MNKTLFIKLMLLFFLSSKNVFANDTKIEFEDLKRNLIENNLLLNSYDKCEEYINKSSVELFLNCDSKFKNKNQKNK
jgi:hypothetical protein